MGNAPAASVPVPALRVPPLPLTAPFQGSPSLGSLGLSLTLCSWLLHRSLSLHAHPPLCRLGRTCWMQALGFSKRAAGELQERNGVGEGAGTGTSSLPTPRVSRPALQAGLGSAPFLCHSKARVQGPALSPQE